eukprot:CAMPEP_0201590786 /NCGR_PEP_ID=MMETSP0190_2-20130828/181853_1 /ASSEMBLY_ACC=CAM_ASM_000263 /TAXON_ID=37353 /ORGANISM="Rosalina sp." /LENGTH=91 /DNA_ID=CAMNT_0048047659 /DNA_START=915 /DNA_END=1190 /DNA_ORIENTATION=+
MLGILMCVIEILLSLIPLKKLLNSIEPQSVRVILTGEKGDRQRLGTVDEDENEDGIELPAYKEEKSMLTIHASGETQMPLVLEMDNDDESD